MPQSSRPIAPSIPTEKFVSGKTQIIHHDQQDIGPGLAFCFAGMEKENTLSYTGSSLFYGLKM